jgi:hypothetical protein
MLENVSGGQEEGVKGSKIVIQRRKYGFDDDNDDDDSDLK